jgi:outer membrane protein OmpA-like peptidoglycan-associated protein
VFIRLIIFLGLSLPLAAHAQQSTDTVVSVYFGSGKYILDNMGERKLLNVLTDSSFPVQVKLISAYTDSVGTIHHNIILAQQRSKQVIDFLNRSSLGRGSYKIEIYGEQNPISLTNLSLNRRVDILYSLRSKSRISLDTGKLKVVRKLVLENLYFKPNKAVIEPASMPYLDYIADLLKEDSTDFFEIKGHVNWNPRLAHGTDSVYVAKMYRLSADRAMVIYEILMAQGILPSRMSWKGMGNSEMVFPNASNDEEKRKNMRVEILILENPVK